MDSTRSRTTLIRQRNVHHSDVSPRCSPITPKSYSGESQRCLISHKSRWKGEKRDKKLSHRMQSLHSVGRQREEASPSLRQVGGRPTRTSRHRTSLRRTSSRGVGHSFTPHRHCSRPCGRPNAMDPQQLWRTPLKDFAEYIVYKLIVMKWEYFLLIPLISISFKC